MTERLALLMREETDALDIPTPDAGRILAEGRSRRHQRRVRGTMTAATAVVALVVAAGFTTSRLAGSEPGYASAPEMQGWAVASGSTVQLGNGREVRVDGTVKALYYTSAGVLVRSGDSATTDAPESTYTLVPDDGSSSDFHLDLGDRAPGTDPDEPYLAYADATDDPARWNVVLRDVRTGEVAASVPVHGTFTWGGWVAPPVSLDGDAVYVGMDDATLVVDWRSGTVTSSDVLSPARMPEVQNGRDVLETRNQANYVVDVRTGREVFRSQDPEVLLSLAPDGRHAIAVPWRTCDQQDSCTWDRPTAEVYDLATGTHVSVRLGTASFGWTPQGDLLRADTDSVEVCDPDTLSCESSPIQVDGKHVRLGGANYEI